MIEIYNKVEKLTHLGEYEICNDDITVLVGYCGQFPNSRLRRKAPFQPYNSF